MRRVSLLAALVALSAVSGAQASQADADVEVRTATAVEEPSVRPWIGVWLGDAVDGGVEIVALVPGGPAQRAELRVGDIILEANTRPIPVRTALTAVLEELDPGDSLRLAVLRSGELFEARLRTAVRGDVGWAPPVPTPPSPPSPPYLVSPRARVGIRVTGVTPGLRKHYGAPENAGVLVTGIDADRVAGEAGIRVGDILVQVGEQRILTPVQLENALSRWEADAALETIVVRGGEAHVLTLTVPAEPQAPAAGVESLHREQLRLRLAQELKRLKRREEEIRRELERLEGHR